jgi:protein associated with RNAse G/E
MHTNVDKTINSMVPKSDGMWWETTSKVDIWKTMKISFLDHKEWLEICAILFKDGVEEMMRNASSFVILLPINN